MTAQDVFLARLDALMERCENAKTAIEEREGLNDNLYRRTAPTLLHLLKEQRKEIERCQETVAAKMQLKDYNWQELHTMEEQAKMLFGECLAFLQAARARGHEVAADLCEIADAFIDELAKASEYFTWNRFTALAIDESIRDVAQIIRMRFPALGLWDLPVAAHEFGHFVAGRLNVQRPDGSRTLPFEKYRELVTEDRKKGQEWIYYLHEYFADVYATYVLGPAYAYATLFLRFDVSEAHAEKDGKHPSYAKRAYAVVKTLERLNQEDDNRETDGAGDFDMALELLNDFWRGALESARQGAAIAKEPEVEDLVTKFYGWLKEAAPLARYNRWDKAAEYREILRKPQIPEDLRKQDYTISDVLNAGWRYRLVYGEGIDEAHRKMITLCRRQC